MSRDSMLDRAVQVLQAFRPHGGVLMLPELVDRTGLPKATVYRLAESLVELGMLERLRRGYSLGLGLFELGELVPAKSRLREVALPFLQDLYEATHETVHLGVRDGLDVVYAERIRGHAAVTVPSRVGGRLPLSCTAVGKALLAFADPDVIQAVLTRPLRRLTARSLTDPAELADQLARIRATGVAYEREEAAVGVSCVASPILVDGHAVGALSMSTPMTDLLPARLAPAVRTAALALSRRLLPAADAP